MFDYIVSAIKNKVFMNTLPLAEKNRAQKTQAYWNPSGPFAAKSPLFALF